MSSLLKSLWLKIKHPVRNEAAILFSILAGAAVVGMQYLSDHVDDVTWLQNDALKGLVVVAIAGVITRFKVWSEKTVDEIQGSDEV